MKNDEILKFKVAEEEDVTQIIELVYSVHGYSLYEEWLYDKYLLKKVIQDGEHIFFITLDHNGLVIAMTNLRFPFFPVKHLGVMGMFFTRPAKRGLLTADAVQLLYQEIVKYVNTLVDKGQIIALESYAVTVHKATQKIFNIMGLTTTCMLLDWCPAWSDRERVNEMTAIAKAGNNLNNQEIYTKRRSVIRGMKLFNCQIDFEQLILPSKYQMLITDILTKLNASRKGNLLTVLKLPTNVANSAPIIESAVDFKRGIVAIRVNNLELLQFAELIKEFQHYANGLLNIIQVMLPLGSNKIDEVINKLNQIGFIFSGVNLFAPSGLTSELVMQYITKIEHRVFQMDVICENAQKICQVINDELTDNCCPNP